MSEEEADVLVKVLQNFNYFLATVYGVSGESYGGHNDRLLGTGQGNVLSGAICRNISCLVFKLLENMNLGVDFASPVTRCRLIRSIIAFVDDADFFSNGKDVVAKLQQMITYYNKLYAATGGAGQLEKNQYYLWRTFVDGYGRMKFKDVIDSVYVEHTKIVQTTIATPTKSLGVYYTPHSEWTRQFN